MLPLKTHPEVKYHKANITRNWVIEIAILELSQFLAAKILKIAWGQICHYFHSL